MSLLKYFGEQDEQHGGRLWYGTLPRGLPPFRGGQAPLLNREELDNRLTTECDFHAEFFDLSIPEQNRRYHWVMDRVINGFFQHHCIERHVAHADQKVTVYLEWSQRYARLAPEGGAPRSVPNHGNSHSDGAAVLAGFQDFAAGF